MLVIMVVTLTALMVNAIKFYGVNGILFVLNLILIALIFWMIYEGFNKVLDVRKKL
jgi:hypothetical protein